MENDENVVIDPPEGNQSEIDNFDEADSDYYEKFVRSLNDLNDYDGKHFSLWIFSIEDAIYSLCTGGHRYWWRR